MSGTGEPLSRSQLWLRSVQLVGAAAVAAVLAIPVPLVRLGLRVNYTLTGESDAADCGHAEPYDSWEALQRDPVTWLAALWARRSAQTRAQSAPSARIPPSSSSSSSERAPRREPR